MSPKSGLAPSSNHSDRHLLPRGRGSPSQCPGATVTISVPGAGLARQLTDMKEAGRWTPETWDVATCHHLPDFLKRSNIRIFCQPQGGQIPSWCLLP